MSALIAASAVALSGAAAASFAGARGALRAALALLFGLGIWSVAWTVALFAFGPDPRIRLVKDGLLAAGGLAVVAFRTRRGSPSDPEQQTQGAPVPRRLRAAAATAAAFATVFFVEHTLRYPDGGWDAWAIWNLRARFLARGGEGFRAAFSPELLFWAHPDYPLLLPGIVAQGFLLDRGEPLWIPAAAAYGFAALLVVLLGAAVRELRGAVWGALAALALLSTPCFVGFAANQQSDVPVGAYLLAACALSALAVETGRRRLLALAGAAASLAAWTKNEGLVYFLALGAALLAVRWAAFPDRVRGLLRYASGALPILALLAWFKLRVAHTNDLLAPASFESLLDARRWTELIGALLRRIVFFQNWSLWLLAELLVLIALLPRLPPRPSSRILGLAVALALSAISVVYAFQPHELVWFVRASADRVLIQLWPSIVLATVLTLAAPADASGSR
jgi:Dolichyl-phosphate-mannose-protein mannosyltransferase